MLAGSTIFTQIMELLPWRRFHTCVTRYQGDYKVKTFKCAEHFRVMAFAQLTYRESLRDIETCLRVMGTRLYHMGIRSTVSRNNLSHANETRDWRIYADFAQMLIDRAKILYADDQLGVDLDSTVYALDATTIDLCMNLFPWARFRKTKSAIKLHALMNLRGSIPEFIHISEGKVHDVNILDLLIPTPGAFYIMDRAYLDFKRLYHLHRERAFFISRAKKNFKCTRRYSHEVNKHTGVQCDQTVVLTTHYPSKNYPEPLRRIRFYDSERNKRLVFLTNNFELPAVTIAELYKSRWHIEIFFRWIKQHLRIKNFFGTSENAVKVQIWTAVSTYLLVAIMKKELRLKQSLYTILQVLSLSLFEKMPILEAFSKKYMPIQSNQSCKQLSLFD
jgi:transposase